jgi:hypothetical protein
VFAFIKKKALMHQTRTALQLRPTPFEHILMQEPTDIQIRQAVIERTFAFGLTNGQVVPFATPETQLVQQLWHAKHLTSRLIRSKVAQFSVISKPDVPHLKSTDLGSEVLQLLSTFFGVAGWQYPCHVFDPRIELFMECAAKRNLTNAFQFLSPIGEAQLLPVVDALNGFAQDIRARASKLSFKTNVATFHKALDGRYKDMQNYFKVLADLHPAAHAIRMEFSYRPDQHVGFSFGMDMHATVTSHGEMLLKHLTKSFGNAVVGYAWKRDFSAARGYQYHVVAILHGPQHHELNQIVDSLRHQWLEVITAGAGLSWNCHDGRTHNFQYRGLIAMDHYAKPIKEHLRQVPLYMTLTDGLLAFAPLGKSKPYGMGAIPPTAKKMGLRRIPNDESMSNGFLAGSWPFPGSSGLV